MLERAHAPAIRDVVPLLSEYAYPIYRGGCCRRGTGCTRSDWLVTGPHQLPRSETVDRVPWGTYHLKENGSIVTACGEYAGGWVVFWGHHVNPVAPEACRVCVRAMLAYPYENPTQGAN